MMTSSKTRVSDVTSQSSVNLQLEKFLESTKDGNRSLFFNLNVTVYIFTLVKLNNEINLDRDFVC